MSAFGQIADVGDWRNVRAFIASITRAGIWREVLEFVRLPLPLLSLMDEILEIADDSSNDWIDREGADGKKYRFLGPVGDCRHKDYGRLTMSPLVLSTMANNSLCSASGTLNFAIVSSKSLQNAAHSLSVILRCL